MFVINDNVAEMLMLLNIKLTLTSAPQLFPNLVLEPVFPGLVLKVFQRLVVEEGVASEEVYQSLFLRWCKRLSHTFLLGGVCGEEAHHLLSL